MRLIDADALLEELKKTGRYFQAKFDIENAPTVDNPYQEVHFDGKETIMKIRQRYKPDTQELLSWDELKIGDVYYHTFTATVNMKTSANSYISFYDKKYHIRSKLLQGSNSKVYRQINSMFEFEL